MTPFDTFVPRYKREFTEKRIATAKAILAKPHIWETYPYFADRAKQMLDELQAEEDIRKWVNEHKDSAEMINEDRYVIRIKDIKREGGKFTIVEPSAIEVIRFKDNSFVGDSRYLNGTLECAIRFNTAEFGRSPRMTMEILNHQDDLEEFCKMQNESVNFINF